MGSSKLDLLKAAALNESDRNRQALQFTGLALGTVPLVTGLSSKIQTGKFLPRGVPLKKWAPAAAATGLFWGGALPFMQHAIAQSNLTKARHRVAAEKELAAAKPMVKRMVQSPNIEAAPLPKLGASKLITNLKKLSKTRSGRRPSRVSTLVKKGSDAGQDLRTPIMGGTKFPTNDSKSFAKKQLQQSQGVATPKLAPTAPIVPKVGISMSKAGEVMSNDPLMRYLKKTAMELKDNLSAMPTSPEVSEKTTEPPGPDKEMTHSEWKATVLRLFDNKKGIKKKNTEKIKTASKEKQAKMPAYIRQLVREGKKIPRAFQSRVQAHGIGDKIKKTIQRGRKHRSARTKRLMKGDTEGMRSADRAVESVKKQLPKMVEHGKLLKRMSNRRLDIG